MERCPAPSGSAVLLGTHSGGNGESMGEICGCPDLGTYLRAQPGTVWHGGKGLRPPGLFPPGPLRGRGLTAAQ
eukprot:3779416-Prymnesium_polylepis.1